MMNKNQICQITLHHQSGVTLIEVLISMLLLAFGLLGIAGLFNFSVSSNTNASNRMSAALLASDYAEIVRANPNSLSDNKYDNILAAYNPNEAAIATLPTNLCTFPNCQSAIANSAYTSNATLRTERLDVEMFKNRVRAALPAGNFQAQRVAGTNQIDIWILWAEGKGGNAADNETKSDNCPTSVSNQAPPPDPYPRCLYTRVAL